MSSFCKCSATFFVFPHGNASVAKIALSRHKRIMFIASRILLIRRCMLPVCSCLVKNCSRVSDAGNVELIASRFASAVDLRDDPAIFGTRVFDRHDQHLMPFSFASTGVVGDNAENALLSLLEFAEDRFQRDKVGCVSLAPIRGSHVHFTREIDLLIGSIVAVSELPLANFTFGYFDGPALVVRELRRLLSCESRKAKQ